MTIAYLVNQYPKVSHSFVRREIQALERRGLSVKRYAIRSDYNELVDPADQQEFGKTSIMLHYSKGAVALAIMLGFIGRPVRAMRAFCLALNMGWSSERGLFLHAVYWLQSLALSHWMRRDKIRHIHAHFGTNSSTVACLVGVSTDIPFSFTVHGPEEFDKPAFIALPEKIKRAKAVVAISQYGRSQLYRLVDYGYWRKIHVVHCGLEADFFEENLPDIPSKPHLLCIGRLCEQKGQLLLVDALAQLQSKGLKPTLTLAGDGPLRPDVEHQIKTNGLQDSIQITGWISSQEVKQHLKQAACLVLPSFAEGLPVVIMEAMAQGRPVISTYVAGIPELVRPGETGWLCPAGDVPALVETIEEALRCEEDTLNQIAKKAYRRVRARHDIDAEAAKLAALFSSDVSAATQDLKSQ